MRRTRIAKVSGLFGASQLRTEQARSDSRADIARSVSRERLRQRITQLRRFGAGKFPAAAASIRAEPAALGIEAVSIRRLSRVGSASKLRRIGIEAASDRGTSPSLWWKHLFQMPASRPQLAGTTPQRAALVAWDPRRGWSCGGVPLPRLRKSKLVQCPAAPPGICVAIPGSRCFPAVGAPQNAPALLQRARASRQPHPTATHSVAATAIPCPLGKTSNAASALHLASRTARGRNARGWA